MKVHIATSRKIGEDCKKLVSGLVSMEECDIFISVLYDQIISDTFIQSKKACFNFHPAILPEYRGIGAYSWAIVNGEQESGVTLHIIDKEIDHGPIIDIQRFPITDTDTAATVFAKAEVTLLRMFGDWYDRLIAGKFSATEQDHSRAHLYYRKDLETARNLTKYVRAFTFPGRYKPYYKDQAGKMHEIQF